MDSEFATKGDLRALGVVVERIDYILQLQRDVRELRKAYISGERLDVLETRVSELENRVGIKRG